MSTRAVYTFKDQYNKFSVYKHYDGYPSGAIEFIEKAIGKSKDGDRFAANELAAAFVSANKEGWGDVYLSKGQQAHGDLSFDYVISQKQGHIWIDVYEHAYATISGDNYTKARKRIFSGPFFKYYAQEYRAASDAA